MIWLGLALLLLGARATYVEPRRPANGVLLLAGAGVVGADLVGRVLLRLEEERDTTAAAWFLLGLGGTVLALVTVLAVFSVYNGVVMVRRERVSTAHLLSLAGGLGLLTLVAVTLATVRANNPWEAVLILLALPAAGYLGLLFCAFVLYSGLYARLARGRLSEAEAVIVLGAGLAGDRVTPLLAGRLALGERVYRTATASGAPARLVTSGGQGPGETVPEATAMKQWLVERGIPEEAVLAEDRSTTTRENLTFSARLLAARGDTGPVAVVSSDYHAMRAATLMRDLGLEGHAVGARTARYYWPSAMIREYVAWLRDHVVLHVVVTGLLLVPLVVFGVVSLARLVAGAF